MEEKSEKIQGNESPEKHTRFVWDHFCKQSDADDIIIIAHSYGGICTAKLLSKRSNEILPRLRAVALTDSVHSKIQIGKFIFISFLLYI